jgi:excisionase family DNA binding protein
MRRCASGHLKTSSRIQFLSDISNHTVVPFSLYTGMEQQCSAPDFNRPPLLLRGTEVAHVLGISRALAYRWMATGILPTFKRGRCIRVPAAALDEWITRNTSKPLTEGVAEITRMTAE